MHKALSARQGCGGARDLVEAPLHVLGGRREGDADSAEARDDVRGQH